MAILGVDHVGIAVEHADPATRRFIKMFGCRVVHDESLAIGVRIVHLAVGGDNGAEVQLVEPLGPGPIRDFIDGRGEGLHHVCFSVEQLDAAVSGIAGEDAVVRFRGGKGRTACFLSQRPGGALIELLGERG
jgi:methylmalonyl-CoA/ethylmalonyl-CoA epimerase